MPQIIIKPFENSFQQDAIALILGIQCEEFGVDITLDEQPVLLEIPAFYQIKNGNFWLAILEGQLVGTIALIDLGNGLGAIRKMFVKSEFRGKTFGVAQKLMDELIIWTKAKNFEHLYLGTLEIFAAARRFYERNGFKLIEKKDLPKEFPIMSRDTHFYTLELNPKNIEILSYRPEFKEDFKRLNLEWISHYFKIEPHDIEQLDGAEAIIKNKGEIFFAQFQGKIVGTVALINDGNDVYEMAKMGVNASAQGLGIGKQLCQKVIEMAQGKGAKLLYLVSNRKLTPALSIYKKLGFVEVPLGEVLYERGDIRMEMRF